MLRTIAIAQSYTQDTRRITLVGIDELGQSYILVLTHDEGTPFEIDEDSEMGKWQLLPQLPDPLERLSAAMESNADND